MKWLISLLSLAVVWGVLAVPIPIDRAENMTEKEIVSVLQNIDGFFKVIDKCKKTKMDILQRGDMLYVVVECIDGVQL
jgi:hypothetical protein